MNNRPNFFLSLTFGILLTSTGFLSAQDDLVNVLKNNQDYHCYTNLRELWRHQGWERLEEKYKNSFITSKLDELDEQLQDCCWLLEMEFGRWQTGHNNKRPARSCLLYTSPSPRD